jgi:SOS-response transcriptional repressor LexA
MIDAGILPGDYVILRRQRTVEPGEIAAILVDGEVTLKRWYVKGAPGTRSAGKEGGKKRTGRSGARHTGKRSQGERSGEIIRLAPANDRFKPIQISAEDGKNVIVFGKYVGLVRGELRFL